MNLWPTRRQWALWSLPSKLTAIGTLLGLLALGFYFIEKSLNLFEWAFGARPEINVNLQFPYERSGAVVKQNIRNPELTITNSGHVNIAPIIVDVNMFVLNPSLDGVVQQVIMAYTTHGHSILEPELKTGLSITSSLPGIQSWVKPVVYDIRVETFRQDDNRKFTIESYFLIDQNGIMTGSKLDNPKAKKVRTAIATFINSNDNEKNKWTLTAPIKGVWIPSLEPGVDLKINKNGSATIRTTK